MYFKSIEIESVGPIEYVQIEFSMDGSRPKPVIIVGENGTGKSTIIYLLLGMIIPQKGQIILEDEKGQTYNLHQELNLQYWREHNMTYSSHENLIDQGSTGQKQ